MNITNSEKLKDFFRGLIGAFFVSGSIFCFVIAILAIYFSMVNFSDIISYLNLINATTNQIIYQIGIFSAILLAFFEIFRFGNNLLKIGESFFIKKENDKFWEEYESGKKNRI